jgi:Flp pilus assembly pilin Flp
MENLEDTKGYKEVSQIDSGDGAAEYGLVILFVVLVVIFILLIFGSAIADVFSGIIEVLQ